MQTHKHHIIPRHAGGTNDPANIIKLTPEEHAEAHRLLYEQYGRWQDRLAWLGLTGRIPHDEAVRYRMTHYNPMFNEDSRQKMSETRKCRFEDGSLTANIPSPEARKRMSTGKTGSRNPNYQCGANNNTSYAVCVVFTDGSECEFTHGKAAYENLGMSRATWIQCLKKGQFHHRWNIKEVK